MVVPIDSDVAFIFYHTYHLLVVLCSPSQERNVIAECRNGLGVPDDSYYCRVTLRF